MDTKEIDKRFTYHLVDKDQQVSMSTVRDLCLELAHALNALLPDGREKSTALTYLEICLFFANAGISRSSNGSSNKALERPE